MIYSSWPSRILQLGVLGAGTSIAGFFVATKHCQIIDPLDKQSDPLFKSPWYRLYNPHDNKPFSDACVRKLPLHLIKYDLLLDAKNGGSKLVEAFVQGCYGSHNYTVQRMLHKRGLSQEEQERVLPSLPSPSPSASPALQPQSSPQQSLLSRLSSLWPSSSTAPNSKDTSTNANTAVQTSTFTPAHLWTQSQLLSSHYQPGTIISNHFLVLSHTPTSILVRCGASPFDSPAGPRASDGLFEFSVVPDFDRGFVEFRMSSVFFDGQAEDWPEDKQVFGPSMKWLHQQYAKWWMENAVRNCRMSKFRSVQSQVRIAKDKLAKEEEKVEEKVEQKTARE